MAEPVLTFLGPVFAALTDEQKQYVSHCMVSWRVWNGFWFHRPSLGRAIKKAKQNLP